MYISTNGLFSKTIMFALLGLLLFTSAMKAESKDEQYQTFKSYKLFEPSGIIRIPDTKDYIVIDDKDPYLYIFELKGKKLKQISKVRELKNKEVEVKKLEGITSSQKNKGRFYAITAFDKNKKKRQKLVRFNLEKNGDSNNDFPYVPNGLEGLNIYNPKEAMEEEWIKVEGLSLTSDEKHLIVGVRAVGESKDDAQYRVIILKYDLNHLEQRPQVIVNVDLKEILGRSEGISSIEYDPDSGKYIILTSYEKKCEYEEQNECEKEDRILHVGGHLWLVPEDFSGLDEAHNWEQYKKHSFKNKSEGVSLTSDKNEAIVVFDDDHDRKCIHDSEDKCNGRFKYRPDQGAFKIVDID